MQIFLKYIHNNLSFELAMILFIYRRNRNASEWTLKTAEKANKKLQLLIKPHFLQRLKSKELKHVLPQKKEFVVWTHLSDMQRQFYENYVVDGGKVAAVLSGETRSPLEALTWLKKLCGHPCLVDEHLNSNCLSTLRRHSGKLDVLFYLVKEFKKLGQRCLIFSQSTKMLDIMEKILPFNMGRIDGRVDGKTRQVIVDKFNQKGSRYDALLLSTKAAGVGLNLTGADRAIVYDPSWNPADDSQAVDRCYRIGQQKNVMVYRLITAGTVEERMYEKQVHKDGLRRTLMTSSGCATERYFSTEELRRLFQLMPKGVSEMMTKLSQKDSTECTGYLLGLNTHQQVVGISSHDMVYSRLILNLLESEQISVSGTTIKHQNESEPSKRVNNRNGDERNRMNTNLPIDQKKKANKTNPKFGNNLDMPGKDIEKENKVPTINSIYKLVHECRDDSV